MLLRSYVDSYLEIPVVLGVALCQAKVLRYLYLKDLPHSLESPEELIEKTRYTLFRASTDVDFFEAPLLTYYLYLFKLDQKHQFMTIVLHDNNVIKSFRAKQLQQKLQENIRETLRIFKDLSTHEANTGKPLSNPTTISQVEIPLKSGTANSSNSLNVTTETATNVDQVLEALNALSQFACQYLGSKITSNYWHLSRPKNDWLQNFDIQYSAEIVFAGNRYDSINPLQILAIRAWTQNFMRKCHTIIRDLPERFEKTGIRDEHRKIIAIYTTNYLHDNSSAAESSNTSLFGDFQFR